jgi:hypothetical protein
VGDRQRYEYKTVKAVRGTDRIVTAKWEKRGWQLVDETPGTVRNELSFRRPKPVITQPLVIAAAVAVLAVVIAIGVLTERNDEKTPHSANPSPSSTSASPVKIVKDASYTDDDLLAAVASLGFTCPSPTLSGATQESAPRFIYHCANDRTVITLGDTLTGADAGEVFILGLDDEAEFADGPWLVGPDWALHGPGVEKVHQFLGGKLLRHPTAEALESAY